MVSGLFEGQSRIVRHREVQAMFEEEFKAGLHALQIVAKTPEQVS